MLFTNAYSHAFYYMFVQSEMLVNAFVLEGTLAHQHVYEVGM
jgi:hypothetical protein